MQKYRHAFKGMSYGHVSLLVVNSLKSSALSLIHFIMYCYSAVIYFHKIELESKLHRIYHPGRRVVCRYNHLRCSIKHTAFFRRIAIVISSKNISSDVIHGMSSIICLMDRNEIPILVFAIRNHRLECRLCEYAYAVC